MIKRSNKKLIKETTNPKSGKKGEGKKIIQAGQLSKTRQDCIFKPKPIKTHAGVPVMAQWLRNPTSIREDAGSIPGLAEWVKDLVLP